MVSLNYILLHACCSSHKETAKNLSRVASLWNSQVLPKEEADIYKILHLKCKKKNKQPNQQQTNKQPMRKLHKCLPFLFSVHSQPYKLTMSLPFGPRTHPIFKGNILLLKINTSFLNPTCNAHTD